MARIWTHGLAPNHAWRNNLFRLLRSDGSTVANYQPGIGIVGTTNASRWYNALGTDIALVLPGVAANTASFAGKSITGNLTVSVDYAPVSVTPSGIDTLFDCRTGNKGFTAYIDATGHMVFLMGDGAGYFGGTSTAAISTAGVTAHSRHTFTWVWEDGVGVSFKIDGVAFDSPKAVAKTLSSSDATAYMGVATGRLYSAIVTDSSATTHYNVDFTGQAKDTTSFTATTGGTVTINQTAVAVPARIGDATDLVQGIAASQPIYLPFSGEKYLWNGAVASNGVSTPAQALAGNLYFEADVALNSYVVTNTLLNNRGGNKGITFFTVATTGTLQITIGDGTGYFNATSTAGTGLAAGSRHRLGFYWQDGVGGTFYVDGVQLGDPVAQAKTVVAGVSAWALASSTDFSGKIYSASLTNNAGTNYLSFNAADWTETSTNGATQVSSTTGETWTLNNTGALLAQIVGSPKIITDGTADYMKTAAFSYVQPETVYFVGKQITWTEGEYLFDGNLYRSMAVYMLTATPTIGMRVTGAGAANTNMTLNTKHILTASFNGASSYLQVDNTTQTTVDIGAGSAGGFTLGAGGTGGAGYSNIEADEIILRNVADTAATQSQIIALENAIHGVF